MNTWNTKKLFIKYISVKDYLLKVIKFMKSKKIVHSSFIWLFIFCFSFLPTFLGTMFYIYLFIHFLSFKPLNNFYFRTALALQIVQYIPTAKSNSRMYSTFAKSIVIKDVYYHIYNSNLITFKAKSFSIVKNVFSLGIIPGLTCVKYEYQPDKNMTT